jgi:hypothetical protein
LRIRWEWWTQSFGKKVITVYSKIPSQLLPEERKKKPQQPQPSIVVLVEIKLGTSKIQV